MRAIAMARCWVVWSVWAALGLQTAAGQQAGPSAEPKPATDPLLLEPPTTDEGLAARLTLAEQSLNALRPTTQPTTQPSDEVSIRLLETRVALCREWESYLGQLKRLASLQESLAALSTPQHLEKLARAKEELRERIAALKRQPPPLTATQTLVDDVTARYEEVRARLAGLNNVQSQRSRQLASGFSKQLSDLDSELERLRAARTENEAAISSATTTAPAVQQQLELDKRRLEVAIARVQLARQAVGLDRDQTELAHQQDGGYVEALTAHADALERRMHALTQALGRDVLDEIRDRITRATEPHLIAFHELEYMCAGVRLGYFEKPAVLADLKSRFSQRDLEQLRDRLTGSASFWKESLSSIEYRSGEDVMELYRQAGQAERKLPAELSDLRGKLARSVADLHNLQTARDRTLERFGVLAERVSTAARAAGGAAETRMETEVTTLRSGLGEAMRRTIEMARGLVDRLEEAVTLAEKHLLDLQKTRRNLHWTALGRRESGLAGLDWKLVGIELGQLLGMQEEQPASAATGEPDTMLAGLLKEEPQVRSRLGQRLSDIGRHFRAVGTGDWIVGAVLVILATAIAWPVGRYTKRQAERVAIRLAASSAGVIPERANLGFAARMDHLGLHLAGSLSIPVALFVALWLAAATAQLPADTRRPLGTLLGLALGFYCLWRLLNLVFAPGCREHRICAWDDSVARHYRRWGKVALLVAVAFLPIATVLGILDVAAGTQMMLWELLKTALLVLLLAFGVRRSLVIGLLEPAQRAWILGLASVLHPLLFLGVAGLLVLQVIGYGVLVGYVGLALLESVAVLLVIGALVEYLCGRLNALARMLPGAPARVNKPGHPRSSARTHAAAADAPGLGWRLSHSLLRFVGVVVAAALIVGAWGGGAWWTWLDRRTAALLALVIAAALVIDKLAVTALGALQASGRLPASASGIIRRWLRGALSVAVVLLAIALVGVEMKSLWAPLSALLAMVAIGFVAVWSLLSNILSTVIILIWRPFDVGERVELQPDGICGEVIDINFMYTLLKSDGGVRITVPNSLFVQKCIKREVGRARSTPTLAEQLEADEPAGE